MLRWSWKHKMGEIDLVQIDHEDHKTKHHFQLNIYKANCVCAVLYEYTDKDPNSKTYKQKMYQVHTFFNDFEHLKRCIGLAGVKEWDYETKKNKVVKHNIFKEEWSYWNKVKLNVAYPDMLKMAGLLAKAGFKVELYNKEVPKC